MNRLVIFIFLFLEIHVTALAPGIYLLLVDLQDHRLIKHFVKL